LLPFDRLLKAFATAYAVLIEWALCPFVFSGVLFSGFRRFYPLREGF
jgi:hypothetical protein